MNRNPWADYWASGSGGPAGGCLPGADSTINPVLDQVWGAFAARLKDGARILDLATGDGAVLLRLRAAGTRFDLTGIDSAPKLPAAPVGLRLKSGIAMESLPFRDASFNAVTSQFGIEYGETARIVKEVARVLRPGGLAQFIVHHSDSAIVEHNASRRRALVWAARDSGLLDKARRLAQARSTAALPTPPAFRTAVDEARRLFPDQPVATEFTAAIVQTLDMTRGQPPGAALQRLSTLELRAADEVGRIDALQAAAHDEHRIASLAAELGAAGFRVEAPVRLTEIHNGAAFAWQLNAAKGRGQVRVESSRNAK